MTITHLERTVLRAEGFTCPACVARIQQQVFRLRGVQDVTVHFGSALIDIEHDGALVDAEHLVHAVAEVGYRSTITAAR